MVIKYIAKVERGSYGNKAISDIIMDIIDSCLPPLTCKVIIGCLTLKDMTCIYYILESSNFRESMGAARQADRVLSPC